jgi:hypothetical protein
MIISIIQPCFVPWLGYFEQIAVADVFVYMDDVQYTRKDWRNNNQLKSPYGVKGISFPVQKEPLGTEIHKIKIANNLNWQKTLLNQIRSWYIKAPFYDDIMQIIEPVIQAKYDRLVEFNFDLNNVILNYLEIKTKVYFSSGIPRNQEGKIDRIAEICNHFDGITKLFDGKKAKNFLDEASLNAHGIDIMFQDYQHKPYPQQFGGFVPYMSIVDLIMNCGKESISYIMTSNIRN